MSIVSGMSVVFVMSAISDGSVTVVEWDALYISTQEELASFCARAAHARVLAVDTEFLREKTYYPQLCLVQVSTGEEIAAIDPLRINNLSPLKALLEDEAIIKVIHACSQDLEVLLEGMNCACAPVFDTQLAAAFLGMRQQASYASVVEHYTGVHLAKAESLTDWSRRPLDPEQLTYAEDDVRYLPDIYRQMYDRLVKTDRLGWLMPEMNDYTAIEHFRRDPREAYLHLKRSSSLTRRQMAIAREVCAWREALAARRNVPRKWILSDEVLVELCRRVPGTPEKLHKIRGTESLSQESVSKLLHAIRRGKELPAELCPAIEHHTRPAMGAEGVIDLMYALVKIVAEKEGIAPQLIANKGDLADLLAQKEDAKLAGGWRFEVVGKELLGLLAGEVGLTVKNGRVELL